MKKIISSILVLTMVMALSVTSFATEISNEENNTTPLTREEAIEMLGLTAEEAENVQIYELTPNDTEQTVQVRSIPSTVNDGVYYEDITFSSGFTGSPHVLNGKQVKWAVKVNAGNQQLFIGMWSYNSNWIYNGYRYDSTINGNTFQTDWMPIEYGQTYYFRYHVNSNISGTIVPFNIRMVIAVANV